MGVMVIEKSRKREIAITVAVTYLFTIVAQKFDFIGSLSNTLQNLSNNGITGLFFSLVIALFVVPLALIFFIYYLLEFVDGLVERHSNI